MLPTPSNDAKAHQAKLLAYIASQYKQSDGNLSFAEFMDLALYAPGLGYYSAGVAKFGIDGDFVTAPLISSLFSKALGAQCAQILRLLEQPVILELGAGTGRMACDIMLYLAEQSCLPKQYAILEVSADLRARQQAYLQQHCTSLYDRFIWLDRLPDKPFQGVILGNEVIDALPVHLFKIGENGIVEEGLVHVGQDKAQLHFSTPKTNQLPLAVEALQQRLETRFEVGYTSEIHLSLPAWVASLSQCLAKGVMLFIDYGFPSHEYYHPSRHMGTLMCHYRHHAHSDPMQYIGLQDITSHVDFTALALAAIKSELDIAGFTHQGAFLINNGITSFAESNNTVDVYNFSQQIQKLTHPHEMGELFKVMALCKNVDEPLQGFAVFDQRHRL